jgi:hypothetical protein
MPRIPNTSNQQSSFLRAFHKNKSGPPPQDWPSPAILRRWLRKPGFLKALQSIRQTLHFQSDFLLSSAASTAFSTPDPLDPAQFKHLYQLLRLSHLRQRFTAALPDHASPDSSSNSPTSFIPLDPKLPLHRLPALPILNEFPQPEGSDSFYQHVLQNPCDILSWMKVISLRTGDTRFDHILQLCEGQIPIAPYPLLNVSAPAFYYAPIPKSELKYP